MVSASRCASRLRTASITASSSYTVPSTLSPSSWTTKVSFAALRTRMNICAASSSSLVPVRTRTCTLSQYHHHRMMAGRTAPAIMAATIASPAMAHPPSAVPPKGSALARHNASYSTVMARRAAGGAGACQALYIVLASVELCMCRQCASSPCGSARSSRHRTADIRLHAVSVSAASRTDRSSTFASSWMRSRVAIKWVMPRSST